MRLRSVVKLYKRWYIIILVCLPFAAFLHISFGQERKIDNMFLELDKKYRLPEQWSVLPFELEDPYKREDRKSVV